MAHKLTPLGERRALRVDVVRDPENAVLALLYEEREALEAEEIAGETRMTEEATERVLSRLENRGLTKQV